jgi:hypothetical protein
MKNTISKECKINSKIPGRFEKHVRLRTQRVTLSVARSNKYVVSFSRV